MIPEYSRYGCLPKLLRIPQAYIRLFFLLEGFIASSLSIVSSLLHFVFGSLVLFTSKLSKFKKTQVYVISSLFFLDLFSRF